jgi:hypothetical protein
MDTAKIKALANKAREDLLTEVEGRLNAILSEGSDERLSNPEAMRRLDAAIAERGRERVKEAAAYTWFNRLCALRFMDANGYTPTPVVTPRKGSTRPAILADAEQSIFDPEYGFSQKARDRVSSLLAGTAHSDNAMEDAYAVLLGAVCDHYAKPMGYLFSEEAASMLLMPSGLLAQGSILRRIVDDMDEDACRSVEVLGWLYQFYIAERKQEVQDGFKAKGKAKKKAGAAELGPVTQLFTPEYIVRFLTQNSLGRLWMLNNPNSPLASSMEYYVASEADEPHAEVATASEIRVLDPACGSGHILVYAYDLLFTMYEEEGWNPEDIPAMILENNLCGLEIDGRAAEVARFALEMKALEHDRNFLKRDIDADVRVLEPVKLEPLESVDLSKSFKARNGLLDAMEHMGEAGSLYVPAGDDASAIRAEIDALGDDREDDMLRDSLRRKLNTMLANVEALSGTYHCVIANPPYLGSGNMGTWLSDWVKEHYPEEKGDLCTCFISRGLGMTKRAGYTAEVTMQSWMFLSSYEKMRKRIIDNYGIVAMAHLDTRAFDAIPGEIVQTTATVFNCNKWDGYGYYVRLASVAGEANKAKALRDAIMRNVLYRAAGLDFQQIMGWPIAYWATDADKAAFLRGTQLKKLADPKQGLSSGDNKTFLRFWWEVGLSKTCLHACNKYEALSSNATWFPCNKGGAFRRWYGNAEYLVNWKDNGAAIKNSPGSAIRNEDYYFRAGITWSSISKELLSMRYSPASRMFVGGGSTCFAGKDTLTYLLGLANSTVAICLLRIINPTTNFSEGPIGAIPVISGSESNEQEVRQCVANAVSISKEDWDAFETSFDFESCSLLGGARVSASYDNWASICSTRFDGLKTNEEKINAIFASIYHMEDEAVISVPSDMISVHLANKKQDIKTLVSYGVGCIFGRYSLDKPGLILADQGATVADYLEQVPNPKLLPDEDNILPITEGNAWFDDDIVDSFYRFLAAAYGEDTLDENVSFIEDALGCDLRTYFVKDFYSDHLKTYQKRPIYWLFQSPKKSFQCLIYMHRYDEGTVGELLTKYLRVYGEKLRSRIELKSQSKRPEDVRETDKLRAQVAELEAWERDVIYPLAHERIPIDLDDGVKVNYNKFPHALAKVPSLSDWK